MDRKLIDYLPPVLQEVMEIKAITSSQQPEIEMLWEAVDNAEKDQFIDDATKNGIARLEKILSIVPKGTDGLEARRFRIKVRWNEELPFTIRRLKEMLESLCGPDGYSVEMEQGAYVLRVKINLTAKSNYNDVEALLIRVTPENIVIDLSLLYNTWGVIKGFTWGQLKTKTWREIKEEVL